MLDVHVLLQLLVKWATASEWNACSYYDPISSTRYVIASYIYICFNLLDALLQFSIQIFYAKVLTYVRSMIDE